MPCRDGYEDTPERIAQNHRKTVQLHEAIICGLMKILKDEHIDEKTVLEHFDYKKQGVTKEELQRVFAEHRIKDAQKQAAEREAKQKEETRKKALAKLTAAERKALGL